MTIGISRELSSFNFERLDILCAQTWHPCEKLWPFEFVESFRCSISSVSICDALESDVWVKSYEHLNFPRASFVQFRVSWYIMSPNWTFVWKVITIWISRELPYSISSISIYYITESGINVQFNDHWNFSWASSVQFRASRYIMLLNRTSVWKVMTIRISWDLPVFNFERLNMWCGWIEPPSEMLWPFEFRESFCCLTLSVSICDATESDVWVKSYDPLNFSTASIFQFRESWYIMRLNRTSVWKVMTIWISWEFPLFNFERLDMWCAGIGRLS